jgi:type VI secretion system protein ImpH
VNAPAHSLLMQQARRLPFVVLVQWLERLAGAQAAAVGALGPYLSEAVRFRHDPSLTFHASDIVAARHVVGNADLDVVELTTSFAGLTGAASPLPPAVIERLCREDDDELAVQRDFLDLFHHRLLGLFYRGRLKSDLPRSSENDGRARPLDWVLRMAGLVPEHAERLTGLTRAQLLALAPLLVTHPPNAQRIVAAVRHILADLVHDTRVHLVELRGGFVRLDESARARLGVDLRLGKTATLGRRAWCPASEVALQLGPLPQAVCARLIPGGDRFRELRAVAELFCPETIAITVELTPSAARPTPLGRGASRLGRSARLKGRGRVPSFRFPLSSTGSDSAHQAS